MNRTLLSLALSAALLPGLVACGSNPPAPVVAAAPVADCVYPDDGVTPAPNWICDTPVDGVALSAVGSHEKTAAGVDFQKQMAAASARTQLAQNMKVRVSNMVKQYAETTGAGDTETVDRVNSSVTKQITDETLAGTRIFRTRASPKGTIYVLVGFDEQSLNNTTEQVLRSSMQNDRAMWQQFRSQKAQDELAAAIAAQPPR
jgi:hypothetical protein